MTLKQACPSEYQRAQGAFKDSMIHWILQFTLVIAFRCVLHRWESQEIRCWKLYKVYWLCESIKDIPTNNFKESRTSKDASKPPTSKLQKVNKNFWSWEFNDTQTGMPSGIPEGARCVQRFDDSLNSAIHITYRISLRSSSMGEPRDPLLKVV